MGLLLNRPEMRDHFLLERLISTRGCVGVEPALEVAIHEFIRVQFWGVPREKKHFDALHVLFQPSLNDLAVVDPQVIENQKNHFPGVPHQSLHKAYQYLRRHRLLIHQESHGTAVIDGRDQVDPLSFGLRQHEDGLLAFWRIASVMLNRGDPGLIAPVNLGTLGLIARSTMAR